MNKIQANEIIQPTQQKQKVKGMFSVATIREVVNNANADTDNNISSFHTNKRDDDDIVVTDLSLVETLRLYPLRNESIGDRDDYEGNRALDSLRSIRQLDLSRNKLISIGPNISFIALTLIDLNLSDNKLSHIDSFGLRSLVRLERLNLSGNLLKDIPSGVSALKNSLQVLRISRNKLIHPLKKQLILLQPCIKLRSLSIYDNPCVIAYEESISGSTQKNKKSLASFVVDLLPQITALDGEDVSQHQEWRQEQMSARINKQQRVFDSNHYGWNASNNRSVENDIDFDENNQNGLDMKTNVPSISRNSSSDDATNGEYAASASGTTGRKFDSRDPHLTNPYRDQSTFTLTQSRKDKMAASVGNNQPTQSLSNPPIRNLRSEFDSLQPTATKKTLHSFGSHLKPTLSSQITSSIESESLQARIMHANAELNATTEVLDSAIKELAKIEEKKRVEVEELKKIEQIKKKKQEEYQQIIQNIEVEKAKKSEELKVLDTSLIAKNVELLELEKSVKERSEASALAERKLGDINEDVRNQEMHFKKLVESTDDKKRELETVTERLKEMRLLVEEREPLVNKLQSDINNLTTTVENKSEQHKRMEHQLVELVKQCQDKSEKLQEANEKYEAIKRDTETLRANSRLELQASSKQLNEMKREFQDIQQQVQEHRDAEAQLLKLRKETRKQIQELIDENARLRQQLEDELIIHQQEVQKERAKLYQVEEVISSALKDKPKGKINPSYSSTSTAAESMSTPNKSKSRALLFQANEYERSSTKSTPAPPPPWSSRYDGASTSSIRGNDGYDNEATSSSRKVDMQKSFYTQRGDDDGEYYDTPSEIGSKYQ